MKHYTNVLEMSGHGSETNDKKTLDISICGFYHGNRYQLIHFHASETLYQLNSLMMIESVWILWVSTVRKLISRAADSFAKAPRCSMYHYLVLPPRSMDAEDIVWHEEQDRSRWQPDSRGHETISLFSSKSGQSSGQKKGGGELNGKGSSVIAL